MALRRMFSKRIVESARFLKMPPSTQALYFHLGIHADDDGVVEGYSVMLQTGSTEDDLKILSAKGFVTVLNDDLVTYINDWQENNRLRADRKVDSIYKGLLLKVLPNIKVLQAKARADTGKKTGESQSNQPKELDESMDVQRTSNGRHRLGKDRLGKDRLGKDRLDNNIKDNAVAYDSYDDSSKSQSKANSKQSIPYEEIIDYLNQKTGRSFKATSSANRKYIRARWKDGFRLAEFKRAIDNQAFQWQGTKWWSYMRPSTLFNSKNFENYVNANDESAIQKKSKQIKEVLDYLSKKTNKHFNEQAAINREPIIALLDSGYTVDNFKTVIDNKYKDWHGVQFKSGQLGDNYLVPNTLFNEKKFERYLNQTQEASNGGFDKSLFTDTTDFDDSSLPF